MIKIKTIFSIFLIFAASDLSVSQQTSWTNVEGKSNEQIKKLIIKQVKAATTVDTDKIRNEESTLQNENSKAKNNFNKLEQQYTQAAMDAQSALNRAKMSRLNSISELNSKRTSVETQLQIIADADSAIAAERAEIKKKRDETFESLKEIEFVTVSFSVFENSPDSGFEPYDEAMRYQIARKASESELGLNIINASIVENGILEKNKVEIKLQGKAKLELDTEKIRHQSTGTMSVDRVRYGLVTVSKYVPETSRDLTTPPSKKFSSKVKTYIGQKNIENYLDNEFNEKIYKPDGSKYKAATSKIKKLRSKIFDLYSKVNLEQSKAINKIESLGIDAKQYIDDRQRSIEKSENLKKINQAKLERLQPQLTDALQDSSKKVTSEYASDKEARLWSDANRLHKQSERRNKALKAIVFEEAFDDDNKVRAKKIREVYDGFLTNTNQAIIDEKTTVVDDSFTEKLATKKTAAIITAFKVIGKYYDYDELADKDILGTSFALQYGFDYDKKSSLTTLPPPPKSVTARINETIEVLEESNEDLPLSRTLTVDKPIAINTTKNSNNIRIISSPNADVYISGQKIGRTPLDYYLDPSGPHGIVLKKKGYRDLSDVVTVSSSSKITKDYGMSKQEKELKKSRFPRWIIYAVIGGGAAVALSGKKDDGPKTGSLSVTINLPN